MHPSLLLTVVLGSSSPSVKLSARSFGPWGLHSVLCALKTFCSVAQKWLKGELWWEGLAWGQQALTVCRQGGGPGRWGCSSGLHFTVPTILDFPS